MISDRPSFEIERKFLVEEPVPFQWDSLPHERIRQGYLALEPGGKEVRIRQQGDRYTLTVKGSGSLKRPETEVAITQEQFQDLWPATQGRQIEKVRYRMKESRQEIEIDRYEGPLSGLILAEVEFDSIAESRHYRPASWMGREVTEIATYQNRALAKQLFSAQGSHHQNEQQT